MKKSRLLGEMQDTARGLARVGAMDQQTVRDIEALALPRIRKLSPRQIRSIRARARMSQALFAAALNTSVSTVQKWEIGEKHPSGPSLKLLDVIERKGISQPCCDLTHRSMPRRVV